MWLGACSTPPKPTALVSYEDLKRDPNLEDTRRRFPDLVGASDQYGDRATKEWQSNNLEDSTRAALLELPGIGPWTADYLLIRALGDPDVLLASDLGVRHAAAALELDLTAGSEWAPWRSYATHHLWATLH